MFDSTRARACASLGALAAFAMAAACRPGSTLHAGDTGRHDADGVPAPAGADADAMQGGPPVQGLPLVDAAADRAVAYPDPMTNHGGTQDELLALFRLREADGERKPDKAEGFLRAMFNPRGPAHANQGNKEIAQHTISKEQCLDGLRGLVLQTPEQRAKCGAENMVPVWTKGKEPSFCIDIFEFPNQPCALPMVWTQPPLAKKVCELQGKRLCSDVEWNVACRADPEGGEDWRYAYGNKIDLEICHTNLRHRQPCVVQNSATTWKSCTTDTEPSGAFPKCRSRFGVFDQHGNVAEVMTRREGDKTVTQLKGSAWFYVELAREPNEPVPATTTNKAGAYPDHCNFDPRWHVEPLESAGHVNYHLGFRCCKAIP